MESALLFIHGRSQASRDEIARDPERLAAYVLGKKRGWLGGLAKGMTVAGQRPVDEPAVLFPFYGNVFADAIREYERGGGRPPSLEIAVGGADTGIADLKGDAVLDAAQVLGFDAARELSYSDPKASELVAGAAGDRLSWGDALRLPVLRAALQFISRKTGVPTVVIEQFLEDVAYYLAAPAMRDTVLRVVTDELAGRLPDGGDLVVVGHSLGSVVAYDLLTGLPAKYRVRLLVTAGSPLGLPVVQRHLLGEPRAVPSSVPATAAAWLNAYDVLDAVALAHPLAGAFDLAVPGQLTDVRTHNPSGPHSISDYLADPDVAGPIGRAFPF